MADAGNGKGKPGKGKAGRGTECRGIGVKRVKSIGQYVLPGLLVVCTLLVAFWLIMARRSGQPFKPFDLTASDFQGFRPNLPGWEIRAVPVSTNDPTEPNIAAFVAASGRGRAGSGKREENLPSTSNQAPSAKHKEPQTTSQTPATTRALVRLVHGYNMPMCMKIKGYEVEEVGDYRQKTEDRRLKTEDSPLDRPASTVHSSHPSLASRMPCQFWRVTSSSGDVAIWVTAMIRAGDFRAVEVDVRSMAFPRVDVPDDPSWVPRGFSWGDLRRPVESLKRWGRARWNASRTDVLTFLRLRHPAWASDELLTLVACTVDPVGRTEDGDGVPVDDLVEVTAGILNQLQTWRLACRIGR